MWKAFTFRFTFALTFALSLLSMLTACSSSGDASSASTSAGGNGGSCNLAADLWATDCKKGCGDVMTCFSICSGCAAKCRVACTDQPGQPVGNECQLAGAGSCSHTPSGDYCGAPPTKCPGEASGASTSSGSTSSGSSSSSSSGAASSSSSGTASSSGGEP